MPDLTGVTVVVTRPAHQSEALCQSLEKSGAVTLRFPVIDIQPPADLQRVKLQLTRISTFDLIVFISANAVSSAMALIDKSFQWPRSTAIAAVGKATAKAIESHSLSVSIQAPEPYNSEALLSVSALQKMDNKSVLIVRGNGGREHLANSLRERGASVEYVECYQRVQATSDPAQLYKVWDKSEQLIFVVTSNEGLDNLVYMVGEKYQKDLLMSTVIVMSERAIIHANRLGFTKAPNLAEVASNDAIVASIESVVGN